MWIDCDPGHDDAMALILAGHCGLLTVLGVSTVAGNMPVTHTTLNALKVLYISNLSHIRTYGREEGREEEGWGRGQARSADLAPNLVSLLVPRSGRGRRSSSPHSALKSLP